LLLERLGLHVENHSRSASPVARAAALARPPLLEAPCLSTESYRDLRSELLRLATELGSPHSTLTAVSDPPCVQMIKHVGAGGPSVIPEPQPRPPTLLSAQDSLRPRPGPITTSDGYVEPGRWNSNPEFVDSAARARNTDEFHRRLKSMSNDAHAIDNCVVTVSTTL